MSMDQFKRAAADQAASLVENNMVVGLGTGSTAAFLIETLIRRAAEGLKIKCIPTSERSAAQAQAGGLELVTFATNRTLDIAIDGADEIKRDNLDLVKGLGGALLREKIVASAAKRFVIIADDSKLVDWLGTKAPIPIEVTRFGWELAFERITYEGATVTQRQTPQGEPYLTDGGNFILDAKFEPIADAAALERRLLRIVGVVETGLFIGMAEQALVASATGITRYTPRTT
jgi:ribose 5-phosphate isomerase A